MDPLFLYRLLRRRWLVLAILAVLGAGAGYASTLTRDDPPPVVTYWSASEILVAEPSTELNLVRVAPRAVLGPVPEAVAAERGVDLAQLGLSVATNSSEATITISAVAGEVEAALDIAEAASTAFLESLSAQDLATYTDQLADARLEAERHLDALTNAQADVDQLNNREQREGGLTAAQADRLRRATAERDASNGAYAVASSLVDSLARTGPPVPPMSRLQTVTPVRISAGEYRSRLSQAAQGLNTRTQFEPAPTASGATSSDRFAGAGIRAAIGALVGLLLGVMAAITHARLDTKLRTRSGFENAFGLPVLTEVPVMKRREQRDNVLHAVAHPYSPIAEAHRYLRSVLLFSRAGSSAPLQSSAETSSEVTGQPAERDVRVIMVTSAGAREGKSTTAANLAVMMAEAGYDTVLMNCDHRKPRIHELFGVEYTPETVTQTGIDTLHLVTDVRRDDEDSPAKLSERQRQVIKNARFEADVVILDTAPILATNDALDLLSVTDLVILVGRDGKTTASSAAAASELLIERMGVPVAGVVISGATDEGGARYYESYTYGGEYGSPTGPGQQPPSGVTVPDSTASTTTRAGTIFEPSRSAETSVQAEPGPFVADTPESAGEPGVNGHDTAHSLTAKTAAPLATDEDDSEASERSAGLTGRSMHPNRP